MVVCGIVDVFLARPIRILLPNALISTVNEGKHQRVLLTFPSSIEMINIINSSPYPYLAPQLFFRSVNVLHYKSSSDRIQRIHQHKTDQPKNDGRLTIDWRTDEMIAEWYKRHKQIFQYAKEIRGYVGWPPRMNNNAKAPDKANFWWCLPREQRILPSRTKRETIPHKRNRQSTEGRHHQTCRNLMAKPRRFWGKERWLSQILLCLLETKYNNHKRL